tara:strand:+ start:85 stop:591 length:507 start_codon:yes stop_codon:yes gene_type:complete
LEININFKENKFVAAKFGKVNGIDGWLSVNIYLTASSEIDKFSKFYINYKETNLLFKKKGKKVVCKIEGVNDIETAKQYVGSEIFVDKEELPKLEVGQYYYNDLLGLSVRIKNKKIGEIIDVQNHGAGDYLTIKREKDEILVPLINDHILSIELSKRILNLNPDYYEF